MNYVAMVTMLAILSCSPPGQGAVLITASEAQLPRAQVRTMPALPGTDERGTPIPPPDVSLESPKGVVTSPFFLHITFKTHHGARIDPANVTVTLLTKPEVDLTERLRAYISPKGIDFAQAEAPAGRFPLRLILTDSAGNLGTYSFDLQVQIP